MIYSFIDMDSFNEADFAGLWPLLSAQRKVKVERLRFFKHRKQSALAYILLRYALLCEKGIEEMVDFDIGPFGKPSIKGRPEIFFNLSHSNRGVVCALSGFPVGIDIADVEPQNLSCIKTSMHRNEQLAIRQSNDMARSFAKFWALKESYLKHAGTGIDEKIAELDFSKCSGDFFECGSLKMQIKHTRHSVISCCASEILPVKSVNITDLFNILLGEKNGKITVS